ncbi:MAG: hemerythrin domain-containing protein [Acidimicrobiia bacterium]
MTQDASTATAILRDEHQLILQVAGVLDAIVSDGATPDSLDFDSIEECVAFFRLFADACHHGKEEDLLFPELEAHGLPREDGPIAVMLYEHQVGRAFVRGMAESVAGARTGDAAAVAALLEHARGYIDLIRAHIDKEDNVLFEMADNMVVGASCTRLCADYDVVCGRRFEGRTVEQLESMAAALTALYPGGS